MLENLKESIGSLIRKKRVARWVKKYGCSFRNLVQHHGVRSLELIREPEFEQGRVRFNDKAYQELLIIVGRRVSVDTWECRLEDEQTIHRIHPVSTPCVVLTRNLIDASIYDHGRRDGTRIYIPLYYHV